MIRFAWKRRSDGEPLTRIRQEWLLDSRDLAGLLIAATVPGHKDELTDLPLHKIESCIRSQLAMNADSRFWA